MIKFVSNTLQDTENFAKELAKQLCKGKVVLLYGEMGAGKTTFTKSLIKYLGYNGVVTSPTFTIVNQYEGEKCVINHFDMYRLESIDEAIEIGLDETLNSGDSICIVEWPQNAEEILPENTVNIHINILDEHSREFVVEGLNE